MAGYRRFCRQYQPPVKAVAFTWRNPQRLLSQNVGFVANEAGLAGGGIGTDLQAPGFPAGIVLINNTFTENTSFGSGGGVYIRRSAGEVWFYNNIIWANLAEIGQDIYIDDDPTNSGTGVTIDLYNNIYAFFETGCTADTACTENVEICRTISKLIRC